MNINPLFSLGLIFLLALLSSGLIRKIKLPAITSYLILGVLIGPVLLNLVSEKIISSSGLISNIVLSFIAFSIGQNFSRERFREIGKTVLSISFAESIGAAVTVGVALYFLTDQPLFVILCFAAIAPATAPAAVVMVVREFRAKGKFTDTLLGVVAFDDVWGLMFFAVMLAVAKSVQGVGGSILTEAFSGVFHGLIEIFGAIVLGMFLGWILTFFSKYVTHSSELLIYTLGFILLNAGLSLTLSVSVLLSNMAMSAVVVNISKTGFRFFESIRTIDSPFYILFFVLAGASLEINMINVMGVVGVVYIIFRMAGKILGTYFGAMAINAPRELKKYLGIGLAPQAGVALGMGMIVREVFPSAGGFIMSTIVATTIVYELFGPSLTKFALVKAKNI